MKFILGDFIRFEPVTLIPFETKLIDFGMMSTAQIEWFNEYNVKIREEVATVLQVIKADCWHLVHNIEFTKELRWFKHTNVISLKCDAMKLTQVETALNRYSVAHIDKLHKYNVF